MFLPFFLYLAVQVCGCSLEGSMTQLCDRYTGQCQCHPGAFGRHCDACKVGNWGFPTCRPCQCNGYADECDQRTGTCIRCRGNTGGDKCERWYLKLRTNNSDSHIFLKNVDVACIRKWTRKIWTIINLSLGVLMATMVIQLLDFAIHVLVPMGPTADITLLQLVTRTSKADKSSATAIRVT